MICGYRWLTAGGTAGQMSHTCGLPAGHAGKHRCELCLKKK